MYGMDVFGAALQEEELQQREASLSAALRDVQSLSQAADALKMEVGIFGTGQCSFGLPGQHDVCSI